MKWASSLYVETLALLALYLTALIAVVFIVFNTQFGAGWEALMRSPLGDRVDNIADAVNNQLRSSPEKDWPSVLNLFGNLYHVKFTVFNMEGEQIAGDKIELPSEVQKNFVHGFPMQFVGRLHGFGGPPFGEKGTIFGGAHRFGEMPPLPPDGSPFGEGSPMPRMVLPAHGRFLVHTVKPDQFFFGTRIDLRSSSVFHPGPSLLLATTDNIWQSGILLDFKLVAMVIGAIALLSVLFWLPFIYRITKELSKLTIATERIAEGKFDFRLETSRKDEIGRLSEAVNAMAGRLNGFVTGQKRFLADISHELYTPLARLQVALELLETSTTPEQGSLINDIREEVQEMNSLVNELIAFSRAELSGEHRKMTSLNLYSIFDSIVDRLNLRQSTEINVSEELLVVGDRVLIERSISNVLRNSVRYASDFGPIEVNAFRDGETVAVIVRDRGPGVPPDALKNLTEPFFRPEPSRSRDTGGVGLGLAIVKSCVEACGGNLFVRNRDGGGLEVEMRLKLAAVD